MAGLFGDLSMDFILWLVAHGAEKEYVHVHSKEVAEIIGVSQQTMSRWTCELREGGWIERAAKTSKLKCDFKFTRQAIDDLDEMREILNGKRRVN